MKERYEKLLNDIKTQEKQEQAGKLLKELSKIKYQINILELTLEESNKILEGIKLKLKELETLSNKLFHRRDYKSKKKALEYEVDFRIKNGEKLKSEITQFKTEGDQIEKVLNSLNVKIDEDSRERSKKKIPFSVTKEGLIYINSENLNYVPSEDTSTNINEKILVHSTGFFPIDNKIITSGEGHKIDGTVEITYNGFTKTILSVSARNTVHFIENNVVGDHVYGTFPNDYIILEPIKHHMSQIVNDDPSDTWTRGSVTLSDDSIILIRKDKIGNIPEDIIKRFNIILYEGNRTLCVENLLKQLGYPVFEIDLGYSGHSSSIDMHLETCLKARNQMISFIQNKTIDSNNFSLDNKNMLVLYDFFKNADCFYNFNRPRTNAFINSEITEKLCKKYKIDFELFKFFINFGMSKNGENYVPISYDKMVELSNIINSENFNENAFSMIIREFGISKLQEALNKNNKNEEDVITIDKNELLNKQFNEINNIENLKFAAEFQKQIKQVFESLISNPIVSFDEEGVNVIFWCSRDKSGIYFKDGFDINIVDEDMFAWKLSFHINSKDLTCKEILGQCSKYIQNVEKVNNTKI